MFKSIISKVTLAISTSLRAIGTAIATVHWVIPAVAIAALLFLL